MASHGISVMLASADLIFISRIHLHKFLYKFTVSKKSILTSSYFMSNFKLIKKVCKANVDIFDEKN